MYEVARCIQLTRIINDADVHLVQRDTSPIARYLSLQMNMDCDPGEIEIDHSKGF